jgi:hypothetical protein
MSNLDKIDDPTERAIASLERLSMQRTYGFACQKWVFRMAQYVSETGELLGNSYYEFSCINEELWHPPKFSCTIRILESDSPIHTGAHPEPCCGTLNLDYQPKPTDSDPEAKHGQFVGFLVMPADNFSKLHWCLSQPEQLLPIINIAVDDSLNEWDGKQVYCSRCAIEFRPRETA